MLVVGLGNPGEKYSPTRHNAGFRAADLFADRHKGSWNVDRKFSVEYTEVEVLHDNKKVVVRVIKPLLFMNRSGEPVRSFFNYFHDSIMKNFEKTALASGQYKGLPLVIVYDDMDFDPGVVKLKTGGSAGGHNGVSDIIGQLGSSDFLRVRIGIGHPRKSITPQMSVSDWVLGIPGEEDFEAIEKGVECAASVLDKLLRHGVHALKY